MASLYAILGALMVITGLGLLFRYFWPVIAPILPPWLIKAGKDIVTSYSADFQTIVSRVYIGPGMRVLDVGCGTGRLTLPISRRVYPAGEVIAVDVDEKAVEKLNYTLNFVKPGQPESFKRTSEEDTKFLQAVNQFVVPVKQRGNVFKEYKPVIPTNPEPKLEDEAAERARIKQVKVKEPRLEPADETPSMPVTTRANETKIDEIKTTPKPEGEKITDDKLEDTGEKKDDKEHKQIEPKEPKISDD